jgi:hypothetical protein
MKVLMIINYLRFLFHLIIQLVFISQTLLTCIILTKNAPKNEAVCESSIFYSASHSSVNFTNILHAPLILFVSYQYRFFVPGVWLSMFLAQEIGRKSDLKMLVKLTTAFNRGRQVVSVRRKYLLFALKLDSLIFF